ncbi:10319_t:CDS:1, partial [Racocetra fulgida]
NLSTDDKKYNEDQSLDYVSDNDIFTGIYNKAVVIMKRKIS